MIITLEESSKRLLKGDVVAVPTETVYGLAASIHHEAAVKKIFLLKGRPSNNPLITHVSSIDQVKEFAEALPKDFGLLCDAFWPGPLTLVIPVDKDKISETIRAGLSTAAFRMPNHRTALALIDKAGPLVMPSANLSGKPSSTSPDHVEGDFGKGFPVLEGDEGNCTFGVESTVLIYREGRWCLGRHGAISVQALENVLGYAPAIETSNEKPACPGQLYRHYAPQCTLHMTNDMPTGCSAILGFSDRAYPEGKRIIVMGESSSPEQVAHTLYSALRDLDSEGITEAWVDTTFPHEGLWTTIRERLHKASKCLPR
jgi:L-threonylcarbamoyladenylate synthase